MCFLQPARALLAIKREMEKTQGLRVMVPEMLDKGVFIITYIDQKIV
jgi:hypothetical protein